jgi:hypothetical protein
MIMLISAGWLPHFICPSRGCPRSSVGDHHADAHIARSRIPLIGVLASRDPCVVASMVRLLSAVTSCLQSVSMLLSTHAIGLTWRAMSQTKAESSRAIATQILLSASLRVERG